VAGGARAATAASSPDRLIGELRLAQLAGAAATCRPARIGFAIVQRTRRAQDSTSHSPSASARRGRDVLRDPRQALTIVALAFAAHALLDVAHRPGMLPEGLAPRWYAISCAVYDAYIGALCYWRC
jgi:hypothetical protein